MMDTSDFTPFGRRLLELLRAHNLNLLELAEYAETSYAKVLQLCKTGETPSEPALPVAIFGALEVDLRFTEEELDELQELLEEDGFYDQPAPAKVVSLFR